MSFKHPQQPKSHNSHNPKSKLDSLSQDELSIYQATFDLYANKDGYIEAKDLCSLLRALGQQISQPETEELIREINGTDKITFENFCTFLLDEEDDEDDMDSFGALDSANSPYFRYSSSGSGSFMDSPFNRNNKRTNSSFQDVRLQSAHNSQAPRNSLNMTVNRKLLKRSSSWGSQSHPVLTHRSVSSTAGLTSTLGAPSSPGNSTPTSKRLSQQSSDFASDSISDVLSSFSSTSSLNDARNSSFSKSNASDGNSTPGSTPTSARNSAVRRPQMRRETTIYGSQLLKHPIRIENDTMKTFVRQTHDLQDIFGALPKNAQGKVKVQDLKRALLSLHVPQDDQAMKILEKKDSMDLKQFITFFQLNVDQR